jgi:hypothetical protein
MPKELTHLIIAEETRNRFSQMSPHSVLSHHLEKYREHYLFASVMHDIPFYARSTAEGKKLKHQGSVVHGIPPNDTLQPFRYLSGEYDRTGAAVITALIAGAVTHMIADCVFHPFVYYFSGDKIARHFRLETLMDTHLSINQGAALEKQVSTLSLYKHLKQDLPFLAQHLSGFMGLPETIIPETIKTMKLHDLTLKLFRSRICYYIFRLISCLGSYEFKSKAELFYPSDMRFDTPFFNEDFFYRHPVTGDAATGSVDLFVETAVQKGCELFEKIQTAAESRSLELLFNSLPPLSLETGLDPSIGRHFLYTDLSVPIDRLVSCS